MTYYLSLGSNLGNREATLHEALQRIEQQIGKVDRCSSFFYSEPWGFESEHAFCNICCRIETAMQPLEVLRNSQAIERELGRTHKSVNGVYSDRTIDIDLIRAFDEDGKELFVSSEILTIPHPLWKERDFVRIPLAEVLRDEE